MRDEIISGLKKQVDTRELELIKNSQLHLGVFTEPCLTYMLDGKKTIESRFSKNKILPFNNICANDIVFVKKSGGDVVAYFKMKDVHFIDLELVDINDIKMKYQEYLCVDDAFWESKSTSKYATLMFIKEIVKLKPFHITKKGMSTWVKLKDD